MPSGSAPLFDSADLSPAQRENAWSRLRSEEFDVLVIGGGVVGAGAALDAASRGLRVALVEARDFAAGTSSRSSKMFHGGLRYLEQLDFGLVAEALHERELSMSRIAPHLVKPLEFLFPLTHRIWERPYMAAGFVLYDVMGGAKSVPAQKHYSKAGAMRVAPGLRDGVLVGGIRYWDTLVDDARHTLTLARTAAHFGAIVRNSTEVVGFLRDGERVRGVRLRDTETGDEIETRASAVINATGVWTDQLQTLAGSDSGLRVRASKGVHIVVAREKIDSSAALILRTEKSVLFIIPWGAHWIIGTTDTDWKLDLAHPAATSADIEYILGHVNNALAEPITRDDIQGVYAGLRPLLSGTSDSTTKLSREHAVLPVAPGMIVVAGGKYTTYRVMAADAVDAITEFVGKDVGSSVTAELPLLGAGGYRALVNRIPLLASQWKVGEDVVRRLLDRYGSLAGEIMKLAEERPQLATPLIGAEMYLEAEVAYAAAREGALHVEDVLVRRTRVSMECSHRGSESAQRVAEIMGYELGWSQEMIDSEAQLYRERVVAELMSQSSADDNEADALLRSAPEARTSLVESSIHPAGK
ncbi:MAG TPA: glycerol-3-phosphate dehydrogenase/oxidase [Dietzia timorensis]|uniref:Glycerol-3-phosphate dehydrogenase n=1 Tax=Dietzia timorensis TaxID=499555 RepID=A0A921JYK1_9ACTN|nr:glycerol-3-phosphate dehydrogenase/oxidase [Dietzia timorensis]HJE89961.1 glycerol-3-phosphate dehydrogenase/oxidase [Dietzia timorensis]